MQGNKFEVVIGGQKVTGEVVDIDPAYAKELLDTMVDNRNLRQQVVDGMARAMLAGDFPFCADPIRVNDRKELDDGEHRLRAIIQSGTTQKMLIVWGLAPEARQKYDSNTVRRAADQVKMGMKIRHANQVTACANMLLKWETGDLIAKQIKPTTGEQFAYVANNLEIIQEGVRHQQALVREIGVGTATTAAVYVRAARMNPAQAETFFQRLADGVDLRPGQPLYVIRQALITRHRQERWNVHQQLFAYVRGWNGERKSETLGKLQFPAGPWTLDHFKLR